MIRIGLGSVQKNSVVKQYVEENEIQKVYVFYFKKFRPLYKCNCEIEYIEYSDIVMYKFFYRLLEEIDNTKLIVMDGCMRTQNRNDLTYNCAHHYLNQTKHKIIFEYFPMIESKEDFMILLDFENKDKYKGKGFDWMYLMQEDIKMRNRSAKMELVNVETTEKDVLRYEKKKTSLFDNLGSKDPDTIPRSLQLLAGDIKGKTLDTSKMYIARNQRLKMDCVTSYDDAIKQDYIVIDTNYKRIGMEDFLRTTEMKKFQYLCTSLKIDTYIVTDYTKWRARLEAMYVKASIYK